MSDSDRPDPRRKAPGSFHHGDLRAAVLEAAADAVESKGASALSLRALARQLGVSDPAIHRHFRGKQALLAAVADRGLRGLSLALLEATEGVDDPAECLLVGGQMYVRYAAAHPGWFRLWASQEVQDGMPAYEPASDPGARWEARMKGALASLVPPASVDDDYRMLWGLAHGLSGLVVEHAFRRVQTQGERVAAADAALARAVGLLAAAGRDEGPS